MPLPLDIVPTSWLSWDFEIRDGTRVLAQIDNAWFRERGAFTVEGQEYLARREGLAGPFVLEADGTVVAHAVKELWIRRFSVEVSGRRLTLDAQSMLTRTFLVREGGEVVGEVRPTGIFTHRAEASLPADLPTSAKVFLIWLVILLWKRDADSS